MKSSSNLERKKTVGTGMNLLKFPKGSTSMLTYYAILLPVMQPKYYNTIDHEYYFMLKIFCSGKNSISWLTTLAVYIYMYKYIVHIIEFPWLALPMKHF